MCYSGNPAAKSVKVTQSGLKGKEKLECFDFIVLVVRVLCSFKYQVVLELEFDVGCDGHAKTIVNISVTQCRCHQHDDDNDNEQGCGVTKAFSTI